MAPPPIISEPETGFLSAIDQSFYLGRREHYYRQNNGKGARILFIKMAKWTKNDPIAFILFWKYLTMKRVCDNRMCVCVCVNILSVQWAIIPLKLIGLRRKWEFYNDPTGFSFETWGDLPFSGRNSRKASLFTGIWSLESWATLQTQPVANKPQKITSIKLLN